MKKYNLQFLIDSLPWLFDFKFSSADIKNIISVCNSIGVEFEDCFITFNKLERS